MPENETATTPDKVLILKLPYSDMSRYDSSGRLKELAQPSEPAKQVTINPVKRFIVSTVGIFFLMIGLIGFGGGQNNLISIVCIFFGILVIWTFIARPEMQKRKAAPPSAARNPEVSISFKKQNIVMHSPFNQFKKEWSELNGYKKTKKGMHLNFSDGTEAYLPLEAFYEGELKALTALLQNKKIIQT
jgi:hypothetical protein